MKRKKTVIRHFAIKLSSSAHVENFSIKQANWGLLIRAEEERKQKRNTMGGVGFTLLFGIG